jgi:hypothetical protein
MVVAYRMSVSGMLAGRTWTDDAACAGKPDLNWICSWTAGSEPVATVVACMAVCASCPVRRQCLDDAIGEQRWSVMGVWGGTTMAERTGAVSMARALGADDPRQDAATILAATFDARRAAWVARLASRSPMALIVTEPAPACDRCGQGFLWPDALCSKLCRKIAKRELTRTPILEIAS